MLGFFRTSPRDEGSAIKVMDADIAENNGCFLRLTCGDYPCLCEE